MSTIDTAFYSVRIFSTQGVNRRARVISVSTEKVCDTRDFVAAVWSARVPVYVTKSDNGRCRTLDRRTSRHEGYAISLSRCRLVEKSFGWMKQTGPLWQVKQHELKRWIGCSS